MKPFSPLSVITTLIFLTGLLAAFIGHLNPGSMPFVWITLTVTIIYLCAGWYLFYGYYPSAHPLLLFVFGFLYAGVFISFTFFIAGWPLYKTMLSVSPFWCIAIIALVLILRKKLSAPGIIQFIAEAIIMLTFTVLYLKLS